MDQTKLMSGGKNALRVFLSRLTGVKKIMQMKKRPAE